MSSNDFRDTTYTLLLIKDFFVLRLSPTPKVMVTDTLNVSYGASVRASAQLQLRAGQTLTLGFVPTLIKTKLLEFIH